MTLQRIGSTGLAMMGLILGLGILPDMASAKNSTPIVITHDEDDDKAQDDEPVSPSDIRKYAAAQKAMQTAVQDKQQNINQTGNEDKADDQRRSMNKAILKAIKQQGLSVDDFNDIARRSRDDNQLRQAIQKEMQKLDADR